MAVTYGFYNSVNQDRRYNAIQMSSIFDGIIEDGVLQSIPTRLMVTPGSGLSVVVGIGRAWFKHTWTYNDAPLTISLDSPDLLNPRIDMVTLEVDARDSVRQNSIRIIKGVPGINGATPVKPEPVHNATVNQYPLAYVTVGVGATSISVANIENMVGTDKCPFVTGPLTTINTSALLVQWEAQFQALIADWTARFDASGDGFDAYIAQETAAFNAWFANLVAMLDENVAANLQNQIDLLPYKQILLRQGGAGSWSTSNWGMNGGTTNFDTSAENTSVQVGSIYYVSAVNPNELPTSGRMTVSFPHRFALTPIVYLNVMDIPTPGSAYANADAANAANSDFVIGNVKDISQFGFSVSVKRITGTNGTFSGQTLIYWMAVGPYTITVPGEDPF